MSSCTRGQKQQRRAQFELCEPRQLMTAQPAGTPDFHVDYYVGGPAGAVATQGTVATTSSTEAYYQTAIDQVRSQYGFTGAGQTVATIDTGMAYDDAALGGGFGSGYKVVGGWDFAENDANPFDDGPAGSHGMHTAGIIGSDDPNHLGVAPGVDLVSLRVFDDSGAGYFSYIDSALRWVYNNRNSFRSPITTVNLSLGATWNSTDIPAWANLENDFKMLKQVGIFISVAAGNSFGDYGTPGLSYPAASPYVVPVMSSGADESLSSYSQRLDRAIAAPGEGIVSSVPDYAGDHNGVDDDWASYSGTSMAAAYMSGAAVIVRQALAQAGRTNVDEDTIYQLMRSTADHTFDAVTNATYLVLNLKSAVDAALRSPVPVTPVDHEGNTAAMAVNLGSLDVRGTASGSIDMDGDQDFFHFTAQHTGRVTISIAQASGVKTRWETVSVNGSLHAVSGNTITLQVTAGKTYTFGVQEVGGLGEYDLILQLTPTFTGLGIVSNRTLNNQRVGGERWFRFQAAHSGTVALTSRVPSGTSDLTMEVYNSAMQKLSTSSGDCTDLLSLAASQGGVYYIRLVGNNSRVQLHVGCSGVSNVAGVKKAGVASVGDSHGSVSDDAGVVVQRVVANSVVERSVAIDNVHSQEQPLTSSVGSAVIDTRHRDAAVLLSAGERNELTSARDDAFASDESHIDGVFDTAADELSVAG